MIKWTNDFDLLCEVLIYLSVERWKEEGVEEKREIPHLHPLMREDQSDANCFVSPQLRDEHCYYWRSTLKWRSSISVWIIRQTTTTATLFFQHGIKGFFQRLFPDDNYLFHCLYFCTRWDKKVRMSDSYWPEPEVKVSSSGGTLSTFWESLSYFVLSLSISHPLLCLTLPSSISRNPWGHQPKPVGIFL